MPEVLLLGATGGMGRRIAALWASEVQGASLRLGVRRPEAIEELGKVAPAVVVRLDDAPSLHAALAGVAVVINAIGPFAYDPHPLLDVCQAAGVHYVDLASEPEFLAGVRAWCDRNEPKIAVCPGASTVPGLIELSAAHLSEQIGGVPSPFDVFLSMGSANRLTPGLLASLTLQLGVPLRSPEGGVSFRKLRRRKLRGLGRRLFGRYPSPFDEHGLDLGERRIPARFWVGLDRGWIVHALRCLSYLRPRFRDRAWIRLTEMARPVVRCANWMGGYAGGMRIEALDAAGNVLRTVDVRAAREALNIPALPSVWAARALLTGARPGLRPLRSLLTFDEAAASLRGHGYEVLVETSPTASGTG
ncbi:MAG: saccharopine dehydrogenase NADP-binding domain-containing protein [Planctomycetia bacterium]|nr:saccharopine dehydrogenase NADP-binding domain-containing protein [Planctomycetia bacterium]